VAHRGREPGLMLWRDEHEVPLRQWAESLLEEMGPLCEILDRGDPARPYSQALAVQGAKVADVARTPSARMLAELASTGESFAQLALRMSKLHKAYFLEMYPPNQARLAEFAVEAQQSLQRHQAIEAADHGTFEEYLAHYFAA
jgi:glutamate--cysteine ligase